MIKVAIIGGIFHSGGKKNLVMEYLRHFDRTKVSFDLIVISSSNGIPYDEIKKLGGRVYVIRHYGLLILHMLSLFRIFKKNRYDVVHAFDSTLNVFPMFVAKICGVPVRINECISMGNSHEKRNCFKLALRPFSRLFATNYFSNGRDCGIWQFGKKAFDAGLVTEFKTVINTKTNAFDSELRSKTREKFGWNGKVIYGFIGRFEMQKNPLFLIDIFNEIAKRQENAKLVIVGHGSLLNYMDDKIAKYGIAHKIENLGCREDIRQFYNAFDAFLLPSLYEGLPVVAPEAQAAGLPVFMSTEITTEAAVCDLGNFIPLGKGSAYWADYIIKKTAENMPVRRSREKEVFDNGYDSERESRLLQEFYLTAVEKEASLKWPEKLRQKDLIS